MKKWMMTLLAMCLFVTMAAPAYGLEYSFEAPEGPSYGKATSVEVIHTQDNGAGPNEDRSKSAALIPPAFGSRSMEALHTGLPLTPNLLTDQAGAMVNGAAAVVPPTSSALTPAAVTVTGTTPVSTRIYPTTVHTAVTSDLYYSGGHLGTLKIPKLNVSVKIYEGTDSVALSKGAGHFEESSIWDGNVALAGHNRGVNCHFGEIHTLALGDKITLTTKLGTRTYEVTNVSKVSETDRAALADTTDNRLALYTCVRNQRSYRWCVQAAEVV